MPIMYSADGEEFDVPEEDVEEFLRDYPGGGSEAPAPPSGGPRPGEEEPIGVFEGFGAGVASEVPFIDEMERMMREDGKSRLGRVADRAWDEGEAPVSYGMGKVAGMAAKRLNPFAAMVSSALDSFGGGLRENPMDDTDRLITGGMGSLGAIGMGKVGRYTGSKASQAANQFANSRAVAAMGGAGSQVAQESVASTFGKGDLDVGTQRLGSEIDRLGLIPRTNVNPVPFLRNKLPFNAPINLQTTRGLYENARNATKAPGKLIGDSIAKADELEDFTSHNLSTTRGLGHLLKEKELVPGEQASTGMVRSEFLRPLKKTARKSLPTWDYFGNMTEAEKPFTLAEMATFRNNMRPDNFPAELRKSNTVKDATNFIHGRVNEGVESVLPKAEYGAYKQAQKDYLPAKKTSQFLGKREFRDAANNDLKLRSGLVGQVLGAPGMATMEFMARYGNQNSSLLSRAGGRFLGEKTLLAPKGSYERLGAGIGMNLAEPAREEFEPSLKSFLQSLENEEDQ